MARNADGLGTRPHKWRGRWRGGLTVGAHPDGRPDRRWVYGKTQAECQAKLDELRRQHAAGLVAATTKALTVAAYLEDWLAQKALQIKARSIAAYRAELKHVPAILGRKKLAALKPADVQAMMRAINGMRVTYTYYRGTNGKASSRTVTLTARAANQARGLLSNALDDAMVLGLIATNPARPVKALKHTPQPLTVWTATQIVKFTTLTLAEGCNYHALYYLALTAGLRAGELLALEWDDLNDAQLHVARTVNSDGVVTPPKSRASDRVLTLASDTLDTLAWHRAALVESRIASPLVFPTTTGRMGSHSNLLRSLRTWSAKADVPSIRVHDLRHTYASMAIAAGKDPVDLARQLGHEDAGFTLKRYAHFFERAKPRPALTLAELLGSQDRKVVFPGGTATESGPN